MGEHPRPDSAGPDDPVVPDLGEPSLAQIAGVGSTIVVTPTRVVLIRQGAHLRPASGVRSWPHGAIQVRLERPRHGTGRIALYRTDPERMAVSVFIASADWAKAAAVAVLIRRMARSPMTMQDADQPPS